MDTVQIKNRIVDGIVRITWDSKQFEWAPGQVMSMPRKLAEWFRDKSLYLFNPGDVSEGISAQSHYKLWIVGDASHEGSDLTKADLAEVKELLDVKNMPETNMIDPATGKPLRRVYIDPRSTGARDTRAKHHANEPGIKKVSSAIVKDAAERIADAAQGATDQEIDAAVADLTGVGQAEA